MRAALYLVLCQPLDEGGITPGHSRLDTCPGAVDPFADDLHWQAPVVIVLYC
jgi:hypothetical protein